MAPQPEAVRRLIATAPRVTSSSVYVPCRGCQTTVDIASAPIDVYLCAACAAAVAGLSRS
jgi:ribosomal protein S27E